MLCDWSLQASTSLMRLSCRILNLWEEQNIENISSNAEKQTRHTLISELLIPKWSTESYAVTWGRMTPEMSCRYSEPAFTRNPKLWLVASRTPLSGQKLSLPFQNKLLCGVLQQSSDPSSACIQPYLHFTCKVLQQPCYQIHALLQSGMDISKHEPSFKCFVSYYPSCFNLQSCNK